MLGLHWCAGFSLAVGHGGCSLASVWNFSLRWLLLLEAQAPGTWAAVAVHGLSCSIAHGVFPDQGLNPCLLHWQVGSSALSQQGSPWEGPVVTHISEGPALLCPRGSQNLRSLLSLGCCACARMLMRVGFTRGQLPPQNMRTQTTPTPQSDG